MKSSFNYTVQQDIPVARSLSLNICVMDVYNDGGFHHFFWGVVDVCLSAFFFLYHSVLPSRLSFYGASKVAQSVLWTKTGGAQPSSDLTFLSFRFVAVSVLEACLLCFSCSISCMYIRCSSCCIFSMNSISFSSAFLISSRTCISCSFSSLSAINSKY